MIKSYIRKKILNLRKRKYSKNLSINFKKFLKFLEKKNIRSRIIGGYYPFNYELDSLNILEDDSEVLTGGTISLRHHCLINDSLPYFLHFLIFD